MLLHYQEHVNHLPQLKYANRRLVENAVTETDMYFPEAPFVK